MGTQWCPSCRSEWWSDAIECRDCGASLVEERPPEPPTESEPEGRDHQLAQMDLPEVDQAGRWRITLVLETNQVVHQWRGTTLTLPTTAVGLVEDALADLDEDDVELRRHVDVGDPMDDPGAPTGPPRLRRLVGFVTDSFLWSTVGFVLFATWGTTTVERSPGVVEFERSMPFAVRATASVVVLVVAIVTVRRWGGTPGMILSGIEVTDVDGRRLSWSRTVVRTLLADGWALLVFIPAGALPDGASLSLDLLSSWIWPIAVFGPILGREGLGLHDRAVGSVVRRRG